jgi:hypothetical protein
LVFRAHLKATRIDKEKHGPLYGLQRTKERICNIRVFGLRSPEIAAYNLATTARAVLPFPKLHLRRSSKAPDVPLKLGRNPFIYGGSEPCTSTLSIYLVGGSFAVAFSAVESHGVADSGEVDGTATAPALSLNCCTGEARR